MKIQRVAIVVTVIKQGPLRTADHAVSHLRSKVDQDAHICHDGARQRRLASFFSVPWTVDSQTAEIRPPKHPSPCAARRPLSSRVPWVPSQAE